MTEVRQADTSRTEPKPKLRRKGTVLVAGAVLTAAAVAIATAAAVGTHTSPPVPRTAQPAHAATAAQLLAKIATAAARQPAPVVRDSDFMYIRSDVAYEVDSISGGHETVTMAGSSSFSRTTSPSVPNGCRARPSLTNEPGPAARPRQGG